MSWIWKTFSKSKYATTPPNQFIQILPILLCGGMGIFGILKPQTLADDLGFTNNLSADGKSELRAVIGGFGIFMAGLLYFSKDTNFESGIRLTFATCMIGFASGRVISAIIDKEINAISIKSLCFELSLAAMTFKGFNSIDANK